MLKKKIESIFDSIAESIDIDKGILLKIAFWQCMLCCGITFCWNADIIICGLMTGLWRATEWLLMNICLSVYWMCCEQFYNASNRLYNKWKR